MPLKSKYSVVPLQSRLALHLQEDWKLRSCELHLHIKFLESGYRMVEGHLRYLFCKVEIGMSKAEDVCVARNPFMSLCFSSYQPIFNNFFQPYNPGDGKTLIMLIFQI